MSNHISSVDRLANEIEKQVTQAIEEDVSLAIDRAFEEAKQIAKSKASSIAVRLAGMVEFQYAQNTLVIKVHTKDLK